MDLDAFFASVEQRDNPALRGKPVLVGGSVSRGVVAAASYEARVFGIHSAMPMAEAMRRCPHAIVVRHSMSSYAEASQRFFAILDDFSPLVEPLSLDEGFLDVSGAERLLGDGLSIAQAIKSRVRSALELVVSVGVAPTKFVAKIASDIDKPDGLRVVPPDGVLDFLHPLPITRLWGVGAITRGKLAELDLRTIGDVAHYPESVLCARVGRKLGAHLAALARGHDGREVESRRSAGSIGHEETFAIDLSDKRDIGAILLGQADRVAARLRRRGLRARVVVLKIKFADFRLITRRRTLADPSCDANVLGRAARELLDEVHIDSRHGKSGRVRLCGLSAAGLEDRDAPRQLLMMNESERARGERLGDTLDAIQSRFGAAAIGRAVHKTRHDEE